MRTRFIFKLLAPISSIVARQLAHPSGWLGRVVMTRVFNRGNRELIASTLEHLAPAVDARLLDVGFGGGLALKLARQHGVSRLSGVDPSLAAVEQLRTTSSAWLEGGELPLAQGNVESLPLDSETFDAILSTNTVYFWRDLDAAFRELHRVLAPKGRLALGFSTQQKLRQFADITRHGFMYHDDHAIEAHAKAAGFVDVRLVDLHGQDTEGDRVLLASRA